MMVLPRDSFGRADSAVGAEPVERFEPGQWV